MTRQIQIYRIYFCSDVIWKVILKKRPGNEFYKNRHSRFGFRLSRAFQWWSQNCHSSCDLLANLFFVGSYWASNPAVDFLSSGNFHYINFCCSAKIKYLLPTNSSRFSVHIYTNLIPVHQATCIAIILSCKLGFWEVLSSALTPVLGLTLLVIREEDPMKALG